MIKKWREECVLFLDDCFCSDSAVAKLSPHFKIEPFEKSFCTETGKRKQGIKDSTVISFCHENLFLLVTTDREMRKTHAQEIIDNPHVTILATTHNSNSPQEHLEWIDALIKLKPTILRHYKKSARPWFATFTREGKIATIVTLTAPKGAKRKKSK